MPFQSDLIYKDRETIVAELQAALLARIPNANLEPDSIFSILIEMQATTVEGLYLANQLLHDDIWIQTMSALALTRTGDQYGLPLKEGLKSTGQLRFSGEGGTYIGLDTQVGAPQIGDDTLVFDVTQDGTIPNPGVATAPTVADAGAAGNLTGTYEWAITFTTAEGETAIGDSSAALALNARQAQLTNIPIGGPGTLTRNVYRQLNGGDWQFVASIGDNVTLIYVDNIAEGALGGQPPAESTAEAIVLAAESDDTGTEYNVDANTITVLIETQDGVNDVTNPVAFTGAADDEDSEAFRLRLLDFIRNPKSGSADDLKLWVESVDGVDSATVFSGDNMGVPTPGHVTIRISGPDGSIPGADVLTAALAEAESHDLANITIHVTTFDAHPVDVTISLVVDPDFTLGDITPSVQNAITDYINSVPVGGTLYVAGLYDAIFGLTGVTTLTVDAPAADVALAETEKATAGTITVS